MRLRLLLPLLLMSSLVQAQSMSSAPAGLEPIPDGPPALDEEGAPVPEITIRQRGNQGSIEEYRLGGLLYMVRINPTRGRSYYLVDTDGDGYFETRYSEIDEGLVIPAWVILRW